MKRLFDFTSSMIGLVILSPIFLIIGTLIWLQDKESVFFLQKRVGKNGKLFTLFKFRSMRIPKSATESNFEPGNNSRVTKFGRLLRRTKLDELPQLINVLIGDMSFVGPRPEVEKWVAVYPERWGKILTLRPGITDNASIIFRNEETLLAESDNPEETYKEIVLPRKLQLYEDYLISQSFSGDLKLILKTLRCIIKS